MPEIGPPKILINEFSSNDGKTVIPSYHMNYVGKEIISVYPKNYEVRRFDYKFEYLDSWLPEHDKQIWFSVSGIAFYHINSGVLLLETTTYIIIKTSGSEATDIKIGDKKIEKISLMGLYNNSGEEIKLD
jgi:hypothetical protein